MGFSLQWLLLLQKVGSRAPGLNNYGAQDLLPQGTWNPPRPGIKPVSLVLAGRFLNTGHKRGPINSFLPSLLYGNKIENNTNYSGTSKWWQVHWHFPTGASRKSRNGMNQFLTHQWKSLLIELISQTSCRNKCVKLHRNTSTWFETYPFFLFKFVLLHSLSYNQRDYSNPKCDLVTSLHKIF